MRRFLLCCRSGSVSDALGACLCVPRTAAGSSSANQAHATGAARASSPQASSQPAAPHPRKRATRAPAPQQDSLAEAARKAREQKKDAPKPPKVFNNDNIPTTGGISARWHDASRRPAATRRSTARQQRRPDARLPNRRKDVARRFASLHHKLEQDQARPRHSAARTRRARTCSITTTP